MEEFEVPTEKLQEDIHHHAEHAGERWVSWLALSTAILAAAAAMASLLAGHHANEAMIEQIQASDEWSFYQASRIKSAVLESKDELLAAIGSSKGERDSSQAAKYERERTEIKEKAAELQNSAQTHLRRHNILARAVTMFQIAIAVGAVAALVRRRAFWYMSLTMGVLGIFFLIHGVLA